MARHTRGFPTAIITTVLASTFALGACSSGGEEAPPSSSSEATTSAEATPTTPAATPEPAATTEPVATPEPAATPLTPEQAWDQSLCAALDQAAISAATGRTVSGGEVQGANAQLPVHDRCVVNIVDEVSLTGSGLVFGISAAPVDAAGWQQVSSHYAATWGTFTTITPLEVADGGFAMLDGSRAWAHAGDRVVYVGDQGNLGLSAEAFTALLNAAATAAATLPEATPIIDDPACEPLGAAATAVLGVEPTIIRGANEGGSCIWGNPERALTATRIAKEQAAADVQQRIADFGMTQVPGLGEVAAWSDDADGSTLIWAQGDKQYVLATTPGFNADQAAMLALAAVVTTSNG